MFPSTVQAASHRCLGRRSHVLLGGERLHADDLSLHDSTPLLALPVRGLIGVRAFNLRPAAGRVSRSCYGPGRSIRASRRALRLSPDETQKMVALVRRLKGRYTIILIEH